MESWAGPGNEATELALHSKPWHTVSLSIVSWNHASKHILAESQILPRLETWLITWAKNAVFSKQFDSRCLAKNLIDYRNLKHLLQSVDCCVASMNPPKTNRLLAYVRIQRISKNQHPITAAFGNRTPTSCQVSYSLIPRLFGNIFDSLGTRLVLCGKEDHHYITVQGYRP